MTNKKFPSSFLFLVFTAYSTSDPTPIPSEDSDTRRASSLTQERHGDRKGEGDGERDERVCQQHPQVK